MKGDVGKFGLGQIRRGDWEKGPAHHLISTPALRHSALSTQQVPQQRSLAPSTGHLALKGQ